MSTESKTEKASPKKRRDERKKGHIFQSQDIVNAISVLSVFMALKLIFPFVYRYLSQFTTKYFIYTKTVKTLTVDFVMDVTKDCLIAFFCVAGPVILVAMAVGVIASGAQTRFLFARENMKFKFNRLSPLQGVKRLFSLRSIVELLKSILKIIVIGFVFYSGYMDIAKDALKLMSMDIMQAVGFLFNAIMNVVLKVCVVFVAIAAFDYLYQWWDYERNIRMTKQEVKEEYKHTEGNPEIKGKIRENQRKMSMQRMMQQVPKADVIIRNPTHFAVALKYEIGKSNAPIVVAKGQDYAALRIIREAEKYQIPIMENRPLARALYAQVDINREIPAEYYSVLAEIMAWVYSLRKERKEP